MKLSKNNKKSKRFPHWWREENECFTYDEKLHTTSAKGAVTRTFAGVSGVFPAKVFWKHGQERGAWRYELARRATPDAKLPPWPVLTGSEQLFVAAALGKTDSPVASCGPWNTLAGRTPPPLAPGFSDLIEASWNLNLPDKTLADDFMRRIQEQRTKHGIKNPKGREGRTTRAVSWLWVELLDRPSGLNETERSASAKARHASKGALRDLKTASKVAHSSQHPFAGRVPSLLLAK